MQDSVAARTPAHLWVVGILSLLWNLFGGYDYLMTRLHNADYVKSSMPGTDPATVFAYIDGMPMIAQIGWGLGVWCALLGSVLLLLRSRWAMWAFAISLVGMALSFGTMAMGPPMPGSEQAGMMKYMPVVIVLLGLAQFYYAWRQQKSGVLR